VTRFFRANPGAAFIVAFQVLLISAAVALVLGQSSEANQIAIYAFYSLVAGVAIQTAVTVREERKRTRANSQGGSQRS